MCVPTAFDLETSHARAKDVYYVAISPAQHAARIYTDDAANLPFAIESERLEATHPWARKGTLGRAASSPAAHGETCLQGGRQPGGFVHGEHVCTCSTHPDQVVSRR